MEFFLGFKSDFLRIYNVAENNGHSNISNKISMGKLGTFSSFQVTHVFQGELYKMKVICLKYYEVLTKLCLCI